VENQSDEARSAFLYIKIIAPSGKQVNAISTPRHAVARGKSVEFEQDIAAPSPDRWDRNRPAMYHAVVCGPSDPGYEAAARQPPQTLYADWTPANLASHSENVEVYSNCPDVELPLNGKSLGAKPLPADASPRTWRAAFEPGVIRAICKNGPSEELRTAGKAAKIELKAGREKLTPEWDEVSYVTAEVTDEAGMVTPSASNGVTFQITGPGAVAAVDNADSASHEPFQGLERRAFQGRGMAVIRATGAKGRITVSASSAGLATGSVTIEAVGK